MVLECPQKPGIVLAVTELLKDNSCIISDMDAQTSLKDVAMQVPQAIKCCIRDTSRTSGVVSQDALRIVAPETSRL